MVWHLIPGSGYDGGNATTQRDACLMQTNLDILDQYALALHGTASKILQKTIGGGPYPRAAVAAGPARKSSVGPHGGIRALETLTGPDLHVCAGGGG